MACHAEHTHLLDVAVQHLPRELRASADAETAHRLCTLPDSVGDWPWHKPPLSLWVLELGAPEVAATLSAGDASGAAYKLSLLHHYAVDTLSVSHAWLDLLGEMEDFGSIEAYGEHYHNPVENCIVSAVGELPLPETYPDRPFSQQWRESIRQCYAIGARILDAFLSGREVLPLCLDGVRSSALCMPSLVSALLRGDPGLAGEEETALARDLWPLADLLSWPGERIAEEASTPEALAAWKSRLGYAAADIFYAPDRCNPTALRVREHYLAARRRWRHEILPDQYGVTLPPRRRIGPPEPAA